MKNLLKPRKGFSLVEVLMAFVVLSLLSLFVFSVITSAYKTSTDLQKLPGLYYSGQEEVERELDALENRVKNKYLTEKELGTYAVPDPDLTQAWEALNRELEDRYEKQSVRLFGKTVVLYQFTKEITVDEVGHIALTAGSASGVRLERPVPVIDSVVIHPLGASVEPDLYHAVGETITSAVTYSDNNSEYCYAELYQWYLSSGDHHTAWYTDGTPGPDEKQHGSLLPVYPGDFTPLTDERTWSVTVKEAYRGHFLFCLVTPLSINGKMGVSVMSNLIYVSDLPDGPDYKAVLDASMIPVAYTEDAALSLMSWSSRAGSAGSMVREAGHPSLSVGGGQMSEYSAAATRYVSMTADARMKSSGMSPESGDVVFLLARRPGGESFDFLSTDQESFGFLHAFSRSEPGAEGWVLIIAKVQRSGSVYRLLEGTYDLAEMIVVRAPDEAGIARLSDYFQTKYCLTPYSEGGIS